MAISVADITKLREMTGAGMMDCNSALKESNGDIDAAAEILRKKGVIKAAKRADKIVAEGTVVLKVSGNTAVMAEVNSETDFVAKNEDFKALAEKIADHLVSEKPANVEEAMGQTIEGATLKDFLDTAMAKIGEKISLRRFKVMEKTDADAFGAYSHMGGKIGALLVLKNTTNEDLARDIAMHVAASNPKCLDRESVDASDLEKEKEIYTEQLKAEGKPENIIENILKGKMNKYYSENCLLEQAFIKDEEKTITKLLSEAGEGVTISEYARYELGEGVEKKKEDFAAEVEEQLSK